MKRAKIILVSIMLLSALGGIFAFKVTRTTIGKVFYTANAYTTFGTVYTRAGLATFCVPTTAQIFVTTTPNSGGLMTIFITTAVPTTSITLTRIGGIETIKIPLYTCVETTLYTTALI